MFKMISLLLLLGLFAITQAVSDDSSPETEDEHASSKEYSIVGGPLVNRKFYITINSPKILIAAGAMKGLSVLKWFFGTAGNSPTHFKVPAAKDELFKLRIVEVKLNQNYLNAVDFKSTVTKKFPEAEGNIMISKEGYHCDDDFCEQAGSDQYGMGVCTPYYCDCSDVNPVPKRCDTLIQVYDPVYHKCDEGYKVKICGF